MQIKWLELAISDLKHLFDHICLDNPYAAKKVASIIKKSVEVLSLHPQVGRSGRVPETRELVIAGFPYIVPYVVKKDSIIVLRVLHCARAWPIEFSEEESAEVAVD